MKFRKHIQRNKDWQFLFHIGADWCIDSPFAKLFYFGILKMKEYPADGEIFYRKHYRGVYINLRFKLPFIVATQKMWDKYNLIN